MEGRRVGIVFSQGVAKGILLVGGEGEREHIMESLYPSSLVSRGASMARALLPRWGEEGFQYVIHWHVNFNIPDPQIIAVRIDRDLSHELESSICFEDDTV